MFLHQSANLKFTFLLLATPGIHIKIVNWSIGKKSIDIHMAGSHTSDFKSLSSLSITRWYKWLSGWRWHWSW
jgi:hypothetical protein